MDKDKRKHIVRLCVPKKWKTTTVFRVQCTKLPPAEFVLIKQVGRCHSQATNQPKLTLYTMEKIIDHFI